MSDISQIIIYSKDNCGYCVKAKSLLNNLGLTYTEKKIENFLTTEALFEEIGKQVRSMPQIKINGELIGGYNQLIEYLMDKKLVNFKGEPIDSAGEIV
jgi:thioredoxin reductase (NADPH)